ncbi:ribonucleotide reductase stimulatory protein [Heyndrickxia sporothermodurans]
MLIVYLSLTGNVKKFVDKLNMTSMELSYTNPLIEVSEDFIVIVPSYDEEITTTISMFVDYKNNETFLKGFAGSGSINYDKQFCFNAKDLAIRYSKPLLHTFEFSGTNNDVKKLIEEVNRLAISCT